MPQAYEGKKLRIELASLIYDKVTRVEAVKGKNSIYNGECFYHDFEDGKSPKVQLWGAKDKRILVMIGQNEIWQDIEQDGTRIKTPYTEGEGSLWE